jgi:ribonuclease J
MQLTIHRGTHEIGGSCIELRTQKARIIIDFGLPIIDDQPRLTKKTRLAFIEKYKLPIKGLYSDEEPTFDAILISHAHLDHYGMLSTVNPKIPIYMSKGTKKLIDAGYFLEQNNCDLKNTRIMDAWKSFKIEDIRITPYLVDHSAFDARAFLIEAEGKRIFYTGDFRAHGRKWVTFEKMLNDKNLKDIDYLIMEGTMLSRTLEGLKTEYDVEEDIVNILKREKNPVYISCSAQNIDRIVSAYKACMRTKTTFILDPYTAYIFKELAEVSKRIPQYTWGGTFRIFFYPCKYTTRILSRTENMILRKAKITKEQIVPLTNKMLIKDYFDMRRFFRKMGLLSGHSVIYSQWEGYLGKKGSSKPFWDENGVKILKLHISGHAYTEDLKRFVKALRPKTLIPIHTRHSEDYEAVFKTKTLKLEDGKAYEIY